MAPGMSSLVACRCVRGFVVVTHILVVLVVVVTGGADVATLCSVATLYWLVSPPSVTALCSGYKSLSIVASNFMMDFWRRCHLFFCNPMIDSLNSL